jgi:hypothetical protein
MNYLAHGYRFLNDPLYVAGTAIPDWLRVAAPRIRARARLVEAAISGSPDEEHLSLCQGMMQHHSDDDSFHRSVVFQQMCEELALQFRRLMPDRYDHRPGLLGHIVTELLLDSELARRDSTLLPRYYRSLATVDSGWVQQVVNTIVYKPAVRLAEFINTFREIQFLYDYADNGRLMMRLNQVLSRAQLEPMKQEVFPVFDHGRRMLQDRADELLLSSGIVLSG